MSIITNAIVKNALTLLQIATQVIVHVAPICLKLKVLYASNATQLWAKGIALLVPPAIS